MHTQVESILQNALLITEMSMELKEKCVAGEKYVSTLKNLTVKAGKIIASLQSAAKTCLVIAQKLVTSALVNYESSFVTFEPPTYNIKGEYEKLLSIIEKELADIDDLEVLQTSNVNVGVSHMSDIVEKIKQLESRQKCSENYLPPTSSAKSVKSDIDEKYPENLSRESLIDLDNVVNLPTVPEDIFTGFSNKPTRTASLSSIKSLRKVKLFLQRASCTSDDEDENSETDEHDLHKSFSGDGEDIKQSCQVPHSTSKKVILGYIKEETPQD